MIVLTPKSTPVPEFTLFNTLVPYGEPGNLQRFSIPQRYHRWFPHIHVDCDSCLGTPDRDRPLTTDPVQAVFVIRLVNPDGLRDLLIVRIRSLSEHSGNYVPWDRWGRSVAVMEVPVGVAADGGPYPLVQGPRVNFLWTRTTPGADGTRPHLYTFDFSRRGWGVLPLRDAGDGVERRVSLEDGRHILLQGEGSMFESWFDSLGNAKFMYRVSNFRLWKATR